jgi:thymidylate kinase
MRNRADHLTIISFSGIDGAGKSTQIAALKSHLVEHGLQSETYTFWDDIVALPGLRERLSHQAFGGDQGVGSPENPIDRRDKNVTAGYLTIARMFLYFLDAIRLRLMLSRIRASIPGNGKFIIFDRYLYDELANLPLHRKLIRSYVQSLFTIVPKPDIAFVIDADPQVARLRKPEYPVEFLRKNRRAYLELNQLLGVMTVLPPQTAEATTRKMLEAIFPLDLGSSIRQFDDKDSDPERNSSTDSTVPYSHHAVR